MNKQILQKLKEKTGASIVLALLFFLICALVGSTVLSASSAGSGTLTNTYDYDSNVYLMKSGADLITDGFDAQFKASDFEQSNGQLKVPTTSNVDTLYQALCATVYNTSQSCKETLSLTLNTAMSEVVTAEITMNTDYDVQIVLTKENTNRVVEVNLDSSCASGNTIQEKGASVSWGSPVVNVK